MISNKFVKNVTVWTHWFNVLNWFGEIIWMKDVPNISTYTVSWIAVTTTIMLITLWKSSFVVIIRYKNKKTLIHSKPLNCNPSSLTKMMMMTFWILSRNIQNWITINYPKKIKRIYKLIVITIGQCLMRSRMVVSILNKIDY